ncbi:MAG: XRE family transcriptional regulator [Flavobacterium sp.]|nr:MAG: XRE family transcriptional regulator [Flavobacterium sp.]
MAAKSDELIFVEISEIDFLLIKRVKDLRIANNMTQLQLTQKMKLADGFISKVETFTERAKYNIRHIKLLASALDCNIQDILPLEQPEHDMIRLTLKRTSKINKDGSISQKKITEVIKIEPLEQISRVN